MGRRTSLARRMAGLTRDGGRLWSGSRRSAPWP